MAVVTLIRPPRVMPRTTVTTSRGVPSIGIAYIAANLKKDGHQVMVIDAFGEALYKFTPIEHTNLLVNGLSAEEIIERIPQNTEIIGISCMYSNEWLYTKRIIINIMGTFSGIPLIVGGEHVTADPEYVLSSCPGIHSCVLGEGETTVNELITAIKEKIPLRAIAGLCYSDSEGRFIRTALRKRIDDIDQIPWPSWEEIPLENYLREGFGMGSILGRNMPMVASRGCPFRCTFCSNQKMWQSKWIARDPKLVVEEMKQYVKRFKVDNFEFFDSTSIIKREWVMQFTDLLIQEQMNITWSMPSGTRIEVFDRALLNQLYKSGCQTLTCSPESGSRKTLERIKKSIDLNKVLQFIEDANKSNIHTKANIVIGFPSQKKREVWETFIFVLKIAWRGVRDVAIFPFVPYPGSELFYQLVREGKIKKETAQYEIFLSSNVYNEVTKMKSWSEHISDRSIKLYTIGGMIIFYFIQFLVRPHRMVSMAYRIIRNKPSTMLERALTGIIRNQTLRNKK